MPEAAAGEVGEEGVAGMDVVVGVVAEAEVEGVAAVEVGGAEE